MLQMYRIAAKPTLSMWDLDCTFNIVMNVILITHYFNRISSRNHLFADQDTLVQIVMKFKMSALLKIHAKMMEYVDQRDTISYVIALLDTPVIYANIVSNE